MEAKRALSQRLEAAWAEVEGREAAARRQVSASSAPNPIGACVANRVIFCFL